MYLPSLYSGFFGHGTIYVIFLYHGILYNITQHSICIIKTPHLCCDIYCFHQKYGGSMTYGVK